MPFGSRELPSLSFRSGAAGSEASTCHEPAHKIRADLTLDQANEADYDALFVPGGFINPDLLRQSAQARNFVVAFERSKKPIATLCHGPWVLASAELASGRILTSWPGTRDDMVNAGTTWIDQAVVCDGNWVTSRGPEDFAKFVPAVVDLFTGSRYSQEILSDNARAVSSPQRNEPPRAVLATQNRAAVEGLLSLELGTYTASVWLLCLRLCENISRIGLASRTILDSKI